MFLSNLVMNFKQPDQQDICLYVQGQHKEATVAANLEGGGGGVKNGGKEVEG